MSTKLGKYNNDKVMIFAGQAGQSLGLNICENLDRPLGRAEVGRFSDNEIKVEILEHVRGHDVFIVQSTHQPANDNLMELIIMADALRRASAKRISAVVPYFGYARQDRRVRSARVPITAKIVADMMTTVGIDRVLTVDLHADQIQGFFNIPVDNVYGSTVLIEDLLQRVKPEDNPIVVSPDVGGVVRARAIAKRVYDSDLAIIDKRRDRANESEVMNVLGDVNDKTCVIVDDMVDTAGTLCQAAFALKEAGARKVLAYCTHPVLSGNAVKTITDSELDECVVANTISLSPEAEKCDKIRQLNLAGMLSEAIFRIHTSESLSSMFP